jgi:aminopeptidase N
MAARWLPATVITSISVLALAAPAASSAATARQPGAGGRCSAGARTLSSPGSHLYPDTGNGGYTSVHTNVDLVYDATTNRFLPGNHVVLTDRATQCLSSFSLDFERTSANALAGPDLTVRSVTVDGHPATFSFAQPAYPGDPHGPNDPNPAAHEASQTNPVGGPKHNPLPPACSPELLTTNPARQNSLNGTQCPANKLVIRPSTPIRNGAAFTVSVSYTGRPGVHNDGDGTTEGWFRASDGGFVTTEPVATEDWMPLNDYPAAKPTYDFFDTVNAGKTAIANGILEWARQNKPSAEFPAGSTTWHWFARAPVASYLVENSIGNYHLTERTADNGIRYYEAQDASIPPAQQKQNLSIMKQQEDITAFQSQFNGTFPFTSDGVIIGTPPASFEEEMETMITFAGGTIGLSVFNHENFHQWWGDNVTESAYNMTFFKEGMATIGQDLLAARQAEDAAGGPTSRKGQAAFQATLVKIFNQTYAEPAGFWATAPSNPTPFELFSSTNTYNRPAATYLALRQILGSTNFTQAMQQIQRQYGGSHITEPELEAAFHQWMPNTTRACQAKLTTFFTEWFDTAYPTATGQTHPDITGPGLSGPGFYNKTGGCTTP